MTFSIEKRNVTTHGRRNTRAQNFTINTDGVEQLEARAVFVGFGSIIWDPRDLNSAFKAESAFKANGPNLQLAFSRVSQDGRLTLVVDENKGRPCSTMYMECKENNLVGNLRALRTREGTNDGYIGYIDLKNRKARCAHRGDDTKNRELIETMVQWALDNNVTQVIWTDLPSNFVQEKGKEFTLERAIDHINALETLNKIKAIEYILKAPKNVREQAGPEGLQDVAIDLWLNSLGNQALNLWEQSPEEFRELMPHVQDINQFVNEMNVIARENREVAIDEHHMVLADGVQQVEPFMERANTNAFANNNRNQANSENEPYEMPIYFDDDQEEVNQNASMPSSLIFGLLSGSECATLSGITLVAAAVAVSLMLATSTVIGLGVGAGVLAVGAVGFFAYRSCRTPSLEEDLAEEVDNLLSSAQ